MTRRDVIALAFMLGGIYIWVAWCSGLFIWIPSALPGFRYGLDLTACGILFMTFVTCAVLFVVGYILVFRASALANRIVPQDAGEDPAFPCKIHDLHAVAISIVGVMLCARALPQLGLFVVRFVFFRNGPDTHQNEVVVDAFVYNAFYYVAYAGIGLMLFFKASALAAFWRRTQGIGVTDAPE
jgi:hypothetical protein